jgi:hypothetical protein
LSESTANLLIEAKKQSWVKRRNDQVDVKGKGIVQTYWLIHRSQRDDLSVGSPQSGPSSERSNSESDEADDIATGFEGAFDTHGMTARKVVGCLRFHPCQKQPKRNVSSAG